MRAARAVLALAVGALLVAAANRRRPVRARRILRISRVVADLDRSEAFYREALRLTAVRRGPLDQATLAALGAGDAEEVANAAGRPGDRAGAFCRVWAALIRRTAAANDLWFQHLAIVVNDMDAAYAHLCAQSGMERRSATMARQLLPPSDGKERAFKFRDPDGHPLELIWFPPARAGPVWHGNAGPKARFSASTTARSRSAPPAAA